MPTSVRLDPDTEQRLDALAKQTGRSRAYYLREAIAAHLDDLEDAYLAEQSLEGLRRGEDQILSGEEFWRGLAD